MNFFHASILSSSGIEKIAEILIKKGADVNATTSSSTFERTLLHVALDEGE